MTADRSRREVLKAAVAAGGTSALAACLDEDGDDRGTETTSVPSVPSGADDPSTLPERQHAWNDLVPEDEHGNTVLPRHQILLFLTLPGEGPPDEGARETVETALSTLDRAYERSNEGLVYSIGYSPAYFDRFEDPLPGSVDLPPPRRLSDFEEPTLDEQDAVLHLASDRAAVVLEAEEALAGNATANGVRLSTPLTDALSVDDRRTGFVGDGMPAERQDVKGIPDDADVPEESPLFMGFKAGFVGNQASEDRVTIEEGPFAGGATKHLATIRQRLQDWYVENDFEERVRKTFSPVHAAEERVEGAGHNLGDHSGVTPDLTDRIPGHAREVGQIGHAQKMAAANRDDSGEPLLLRRHFESTDGGESSLHFPSLQRGIGEFERVREAMNGADVDSPTIRQRVNNGILEYIFVKHRGNFLVPPRRHRALPTPRPE
ncbi:Tat pathway signal protein [Halostella sp. JP-L12]|uniref:DUF7405 family protein n=1 Tax=Halostella TaxID=1843185 RepID=UPI000EF77572|nr:MULTISPECIES: Tat pathway signal protein [Halostella]NHN48832.1 Tat pathway signal protein [Halostella sp. JP-L12]